MWPGIEPWFGLEPPSINLVISAGIYHIVMGRAAVPRSADSPVASGGGGSVAVELLDACETFWSSI